jgi:hypothetical protein
VALQRTGVALQRAGVALQRTGVALQHTDVALWVPGPADDRSPLAASRSPGVTVITSPGDPLRRCCVRATVSCGTEAI